MKGEGKHWGKKVLIIYNTYSDIHEIGRKQDRRTDQRINQKTKGRMKLELEL